MKSSTGFLETSHHMVFSHVSLSGLFFLLPPYLSIFFFFFHYISQNTLQKLNKILIGFEKPSNRSFISFKINSFCWIQSHSFSHIGTSPAKSTYSVNRPWQFSLNRIRASVALFITSFLLIVTSVFFICTSQQLFP